VNLVVLLNKVVDVALWAIIREVTTICHTRGAFKMLVVTCRKATIAVCGGLLMNHLNEINNSITNMIQNIF
jgi:hypothetical protein